MYVVHFPFGATMEFSDRELSPDPSLSDGSSVEFVVETPGSDWEDNPSTIVLSDNEEGPPKPKMKTLKEYFTPTPRSTLPFGRSVPRSQLTSSASTQSTDDADPGPSDSSPVEAGSAQGESVAKRKATYCTYSLRQKLEVLDYVKAHSAAISARNAHTEKLSNVSSSP